MEWTSLKISWDNSLKFSREILRNSGAFSPKLYSHEPHVTFYFSILTLFWSHGETVTYKTLTFSKLQKRLKYIYIYININIKITKLPFITAVQMAVAPPPPVAPFPSHVSVITVKKKSHSVCFVLGWIKFLFIIFYIKEFWIKISCQRIKIERQNQSNTPYWNKTKTIFMSSFLHGNEASLFVAR